MPKERFPSDPGERKKVAQKIIELRKKRDEHRKAGTQIIRTPAEIEEGVKIFGEEYRAELSQPIDVARTYERTARNVLRDAKEPEIRKRIMSIYHDSRELLYRSSFATEEEKLAHAEKVYKDIINNDWLLEKEFLEDINPYIIAGVLSVFIDSYQENSLEYADQGANNPYCQVLKKLQEYALAFIERNVKGIIVKIKKGSAENLISLLTLLIRDGSPAQSDIGLEAFRECETACEEETERSNEISAYGERIIKARLRAYLIVFGTDEISARVLEQTITELKEKPLASTRNQQESVQESVIDQLNAFYRLKDLKVPEKMKFIIQTIIAESGLDAEECIKAWRSGSWNHLDVKLYDRASMELNLDALLSLEREYPGGAKLLRDNFGILDFGRYPKGLLVKQCEEFESVDKPYGIIIIARDDHDGVLYNNLRHWEKLLVQLGGQYAVRAAECESKQDIVRLLLRLDKKYGDAHKISFCFLSAHGGEEGTAIFGSSNEKRHIVTAGDFKGQGAKRLGGFFEPNAPVVMIVCYGGNILGKSIEAETGLSTIGMKKSGNVEDINTTITPDGRVNFDVKYNWTETLVNGSLQ